ncbi:hypothetical protein CBY_0059 [Clostridium butyricum 5521]|uniref:Uncharacterized protein n=1 Tax=Clostridium butyricum E4 str. BoNT E BL5262 TaxID=632245 RepID=C4IL78_CLOBU|nr:hypothetical protein CBY_0059 [Clostridium butyricum 5521]EEP54754.1 hypothetical protein CLP_1511 [Clostridium butyricum E4 str. BoNT E BL5262]
MYIYKQLLKKYKSKVKIDTWSKVYSNKNILILNANEKVGN